MGSGLDLQLNREDILKLFSIRDRTRRRSGSASKMNKKTGRDILLTGRFRQNLTTRADDSHAAPLQHSLWPFVALIFIVLFPVFLLKSLQFNFQLHNGSVQRPFAFQCL